MIGAAPERKTNEAALTTTMVEKGSDSVIYIKTESQTLALTFINDGTILLAGCTFDAGAAEGKITPSGNPYLRQLRHELYNAAAQPVRSEVKHPG